MRWWWCIVGGMTTHRSVWLGSLLAVIVAVAVVVTPYWVMRPFRPQGATELQVALVALRLAPWLLGAAAIVALWMTARAWTGGAQGLRKWGRRVATGLSLVLVLGAVGASRINLFEKMFAPLPGPTYVAAAGAPLPADDVVMVVAEGGAGRAYPVRILAYHHVVNDEVGGVPLVATY